MVVGACVQPNPRIEVRRRLFRIYRYLNTIHALCYKNASPTLSTRDVEKGFVELGLLTKEEAWGVVAAANKPRDNVLTWLLADIFGLLEMEGVMQQHVGMELTNAVRKLRGSCARHHGKWAFGGYIFLLSSTNYLHMDF